MKNIFCAYNIKSGGGAILFAELMNKLGELEGVTVIVSNLTSLPIDKRADFQIKKIGGCLVSRLYIEFWLLLNVSRDDAVLCFGNFPPLFRLRGKVVVYLQNRFLIDRLPDVKFSYRFRFKVLAQKIYLRQLIGNANEFIVQTKSMASLLYKLMNAKTNRPVRLLPFISNNMLRSTGIESARCLRSIDFIYPASGDAHKNHKNLIDAWVLLAGDGYFPSLLLTIDHKSYPALSRYVTDQSRKYGLKVKNVGFQGAEDLKILYAKSRALIFPSLLESFGLPLLEAKSFMLPVLASELDYVRDVVIPDFTFDPLSPVSISRAVKRFLKIDEVSINLLTPSQFLESAMRHAGKY
jgi:glycosyltransferase involved in cell wall biosynthesis